MDLSHVTYAASQKIATITLSTPDTGNVLDEHVVRELTQSFAQAQRDSTVRAIILKSSGGYFCRGFADHYLERIVKSDLSQNLQESLHLMNLSLQIYSMRKPVIACVQGPARGAGCGLASVCDFIIASEEGAEFSFDEVRHGLVPAISLLFVVRKIGEGRARDLLLRGTVLSAREAERIGLVSSVHPQAELEKATLDFVRQLTKTNSASSMGLVKELLSRVHGMSTQEALEYSSNVNAISRMTDDCKKGIADLLKKEESKW